MAALNTCRSTVFLFAACTTVHTLQAQGLDTLCVDPSLGRFWSLNANGDIQQWSLTNGTITGGAVVLTSEPQLGDADLAFCSAFGPTTFLIGDPPDYISYYAGGDWNEVTTPVNYPAHMVGKTDWVYYVTGPYDLMRRQGTTIEVLDYSAFPGNYWSDPVIAPNGDILAFFETGGTVEELRRFTEEGTPITSYGTSFWRFGFFSTLMFGDTLYLAFDGDSDEHTDAFVPAWVDGDSIALGEDIPFDMSTFKDFTNCAPADIWTGLTERAVEERTLSWPVPTDGGVNVAIPAAAMSGRIHVRVTDLSGRLVLNPAPSLSNGSIFLDLSCLQNGRYHLHIEPEEASIHTPIIVQH